MDKGYIKVRNEILLVEKNIIIRRLKYIRERLAIEAHHSWARWMDYIFERGHFAPDGDFIIPALYARKWFRQKDTAYAELTPREKDSDRAVVDKMMNLFVRGLKQRGLSIHVTRIDES
jgi:hypothetical protein